MTKLLKKITLVSTTAFMLCITTTTTTNFPTISMEIENIQISEDNKQNTNTKNKHEIQPLGEKGHKDDTEIPIS